MLLVEFDLTTGKMLGGAMNGSSFIDLPESSTSCIVEDGETAKAIWFSHTNGGEVIINVDGSGKFKFAEIQVVTPIAPEPPKTPEQLKIEQLEIDLAAANARFEDIELMLVDMLMGGV